MKRTICDLCGNDVNCGVKVGRKVKVKVWDRWWDMEGWHTLDICDNCKKAIIERSKEIAKEQK